MDINSICKTQCTDTYEERIFSKWRHRFADSRWHRFCVYLSLSVFIVVVRACAYLSDCSNQLDRCWRSCGSIAASFDLSLYIFYSRPTPLNIVPPRSLYSKVTPPLHTRLPSPHLRTPRPPLSPAKVNPPLYLLRIIPPLSPAKVRPTLSLMLKFALPSLVLQSPLPSTYYTTPHPC